MTKSIAIRQQVLPLLFLVLGALGVTTSLLRSGPESKAPAYQVREVELDQAKALIDGGAVIIDVREQDAFDKRHIPGALVIPLTQLRYGIPATLTAAKTENILVYCGDGSKRGPEGTHLLNQAGYNNAVNLRPGMSGWADAGLPVVQR